MFMQIVKWCERWLHEYNRNTQIRAWIEETLNNHPDVTDRMTDWAGLADPKKPAPIEKNAFFIGHNLYIGHNLSAAPMADHYCIWTAEDPSVHIHKATLLFDNKVVLHGDWERIVVDLLHDAYNKALALKSEQLEKSRKADADRLEYFSRI